MTGVRCPTATATATSGSVQLVVVDEISSVARAGVDWTAHAAVAGTLPADAVAPPRPGRSGDQELACPGLETQYDLSEDGG